MNVDEFKSIMDQSNITFLPMLVMNQYRSIMIIINRAKKLNIKHVIVPAPPARKDGEFKNTFNMNEEEWI